MIAQNFQPEPKHDAMIGPVTAWFHRLDEILADLRSMKSTRLDRRAVQKLFRVRQRRARQIMAGLSRACGSAAPRRCRGRLSSRAWSRRRPAAADVRERLLEDLSAGIALRPGELRIAFCGAEDLAAKLLEISQAMAND